MKKISALYFLLFALFSGAHAAQEGAPVYYQSRTTNANRANYGAYRAAGYTNYVGQNSQKQVVGQNAYSYRVPAAQSPIVNGTMTVNGIATPIANGPSTSLYADYAYRFANFEFQTGVNSILKWDDMVFNDITVGINHNFALRDFDLFAYAEYTYGSLAKSGWSVDYDLQPYDNRDPAYGIFTISVGDISGDTNHLRLGLGAKHIWDIGGWKLSPSIGYEIFKHNLEMSNHVYPNQGIYLPLMTDNGFYVYGREVSDGNGGIATEYVAAPTGTVMDDAWYQVCMSPEDILLVQTGADSNSGSVIDLGTSFGTGIYNPGNGTVPWGVGGGQCVVIGGDGKIEISGTTHIYNTTWSGLYVGLEIEKQMTLSDKLRFYVQFGMPSYSSEGIWPNRTDWQQNPSFIDEGSNGAYSYRAEMEYNMKLSDRLQLALKADTHYFYVGGIGGELYVAGYQTIYETDDGWVIEDVPAYTQKMSDSLKYAEWKSFGLSIGLKYAF